MSAESTPCLERFFALLPDTRLTELLFAVTAAVLVVVCRALIRSQLELRRSGQVPPPSP